MCVPGDRKGGDGALSELATVEELEDHGVRLSFREQALEMPLYEFLEQVPGWGNTMPVESRTTESKIELQCRPCGFRLGKDLACPTHAYADALIVWSRELLRMKLRDIMKDEFEATLTPQERHALMITFYVICYLFQHNGVVQYEIEPIGTAETLVLIEELGMRV